MNIDRKKFSYVIRQLPLKPDHKDTAAEEFIAWAEDFADGIIRLKKQLQRAKRIAILRSVQRSAHELMRLVDVKLDDKSQSRFKRWIGRIVRNSDQPDKENDSVRGEAEIVELFDKLDLAIAAAEKAIERTNKKRPPDDLRGGDELARLARALRQLWAKHCTRKLRDRDIPDCLERTVDAISGLKGGKAKTLKKHIKSAIENSNRKPSAESEASEHDRKRKREPGKPVSG